MARCLRIAASDSADVPGFVCGSTNGNSLRSFAGREKSFGTCRHATSFDRMRWIAPIGTMMRTATKDTQINGIAIAEGTPVSCIFASANRDEARWDDPDRFDIFRPARSHLGWGHGVHVCLGMHLARLEMRTALNLLFDRLPNLRLEPGDSDPHIRGQVFRSPTTLPVRFDV